MTFPLSAGEMVALAKAGNIDPYDERLTSELIDFYRFVLSENEAGPRDRQTN